MFLRLLALCALVLPCLGGCATAPSAEAIAAAEIGDAPSVEDCILTAKVMTMPTLKDPGSALFAFGTSVRRSAYPKGFGPYVVAWLFNYSVNAKNSFGGYVGAEPRTLWFVHGECVAFSEKYGPLTLKDPLSMVTIRAAGKEMGLIEAPPAPR